MHWKTHRTVGNVMRLHGIEKCLARQFLSVSALEPIQTDLLLLCTFAAVSPLVEPGKHRSVSPGFNGVNQRKLTAEPESPLVPPGPLWMVCVNLEAQSSPTRGIGSALSAPRGRFPAMPTSEVLYDEAIELHQKGDVEGAIGKLQQLVEREPNYALAHSALSVFLSQQAKHEQAIEHGQKVCELEPEDPFSFIALSLVCQKAGLIAEAERAMMQARQAQVSDRAQE